MPGHFDQYSVKPERIWMLHYAGYDGDDIMGAVEGLGWKAIGGWGRDGWNLGSWPLVIVYHREREGQFEAVLYVEGDVDAYRFPTRAILNAWTDETAFFYWKHAEEEWVKDYASVDELPEEIRGPYRNG